MQNKAVIFREDRTNDVVIPKKKDIEGKTFKHQNEIYFLNPDRVQITWNRRFFFWKKYYATSYYVRGIANPLPVPDFKKVEEQVIEAGNPLFDGNGKPVTQQVFPKVVDLGIPSEELAAIFNPWFYRIIGNLKATVMERVMFLMTLGTLLLAIFIAYYVSTHTPPSAEEIANAIIQAQQNPNAGTQVPPPQGSGSPMAGV